MLRPSRLNFEARLARMRSWCDTALCEVSVASRDVGDAGAHAHEGVKDLDARSCR